MWTIKPYLTAILPVPGWECLFGSNTCEMRPLAFWIWVLRSKNRIGLIDTGLPEGQDLADLNHANQALDRKCVFEQHTPISEILVQENIAPEQIDFVLLSQLITYATGGLCRDLFPKAHIYAAFEGILEFLTDIPGHPPRAFYLTSGSWSYLRELLVENRITFAKTPTEVYPGLIYEPTGGHHPGSAGVRIVTRHGTVGILETAFIQENITRETPIGIAENAAENRKVIREYRRKCDLTLAGHEPLADELLCRFMI